MANKQREIPSFLYSLLSGAIILLVWYLLTLFFPPIVIPTIGSVWVKLKAILTTPMFYQMIWLTTQRMAIGLAIGVSVGLVAGIIMGSLKNVGRLLSPVIGMIQTIPPVSWVILALVWFGINSKPVIFIIALSTVPIVAITVRDGIAEIDPKLMQMAKLFHFSPLKRLLHITLPSVMPYFQSSFRIALGSGWKIAAMGEVLTVTDGIGGMIKLARLNIESDSIIAWSIVVVLLFYLSDGLLKLILFGKERQQCLK